MQYYLPNEKDFTVNGREFNPTKCMLDMNLNGNWKLDIECQEPLEANTVVKVPTPYGEQLYRIPERAIEVRKGKSGVKATALPIFLDAKNEVFLLDSRAVNVTAQGALDVIFKDTKYTAESDITKPNTAYFYRMNGIEALASRSDNSFVNRWGGEFIYDNYHLIADEKVGKNENMRIEAGFNMTAIKQTVDFSELCTVIVPESFNGYTCGMVESPRVDKYPMRYVRTMKFDFIKMKQDVSELEDTTNLIVCETIQKLHAALRTECEKQWGYVDVPRITYAVDIVDLANFPEYADFKNVLKLNLGDTVLVRNKEYSIDQSARVVDVKYNCITKSIEKLVIGEFRPNIYNDINSMRHDIDATKTEINGIGSTLDKVYNPVNNSIHAEMIQGTINGARAQLKIQKKYAGTADYKALLFEDLDPRSDTFGALCIGTQGIQIAQKRTAADDDWKWTTAINFESVIADRIITGILSDKLGNFYLDMATGELVMKSGTFKGDINTQKDIHIGKDIYMKRMNEKDNYSEIRFPEGFSPSIRMGCTVSGSTHANDLDIIINKELANIAKLYLRNWSGDQGTVGLQSGKETLTMNSGSGSGYTSLKSDQLMINVKSLMMTINGRSGYTGTKNGCKFQNGICVG